MKVKNIISGVISLALSVYTISYGAAPAEPLPTSRRMAQTIQVRPQEVEKQQEAAKQDAASDEKTALDLLFNKSQIDKAAYDREFVTYSQFMHSFNSNKSALQKSKTAQTASAIDQQIRRLDGEKRQRTSAIDAKLIISLRSKEAYQTAQIEALTATLRKCQSDLIQTKQELADEPLTLQMYPDALVKKTIIVYPPTGIKK